MLSCKVGKKTIYAIDKGNKETLKKWSNKGVLKCPICNEVLVFKAGKIKTWHFAHKVDSDCESKSFEPETEEHLKGKVILYKWLKKQPNIKEVELEKWLSDLKLRPDLAFEDSSGKNYCIEFQCSPTTLEHIYFKNNLYKTLNYHPIWIFGTQRISNKSKLLENTLNSYKMNVEKKIFYKKNFQHPMILKTNFYFEQGMFFVNSEIIQDFKKELKPLVKNHRMEKEKKLKYKQSLLREQKELFNKIKQEVEEEEMRFKQLMYEQERNINLSKKFKISKSLRLDFLEFEQKWGNVEKWLSYLQYFDSLNLTLTNNFSKLYNLRLQQRDYSRYLIYRKYENETLIDYLFRHYRHENVFIEMLGNDTVTRSFILIIKIIAKYTDTKINLKYDWI